ncbi:MAG: hypothetical protein ACJA04_000496 [Cellvibrionaceae bacterium]|jgi:uncharacterized protein involved in type VI secretion and phage assembly
MATQADYRVKATLGGLDLAVTHFELQEGLSELFQLTLDVVEPLRAWPSVSATDLIDRMPMITLWQGDTIKRHLHGIIHRVSETGRGARYQSYRIHASPTLPTKL